MNNLTGERHPERSPVNKKEVYFFQIARMMLKSGSGRRLEIQACPRSQAVSQLKVTRARRTNVNLLRR